MLHAVAQIAFAVSGDGGVHGTHQGGGTRFLGAFQCDFGHFAVGEYREVRNQRVKIVGRTNEVVSFTTTPVEGTNWQKAPTFGQPTSRYAYQTPRTFQFAVGFRF